MNPQEHPHVGTIVPFTAATSSTVEETRADHGGTNGTGNAVALKLKKVPQDQWVKNALTRQFPPPLFLKLLERSPYEPLQKSYRNSNELPEVVKGAPIIRIGITFLAGGDGPTVRGAEMKRLKPGKPDQKTPEWRVFTAATLLKTFVVREDLSIHQSDASASILASQIRKDDKKRLSISQAFAPPRPNSAGSSASNTSANTDNSEETALISRNIQDNTLTIDSGYVELLHDNCSEDHNFHITSTLIEIDLFSMRDLMINYHQIVQSGQRNLKPKEIMPILNVMINDVRRLCTRSPRLFRMSTRALIAQSTSTRYGVDYGSLFVTLTTSEGICHLIEESSNFYHSLDENKADQAKIRPKFLQMLVLLLSLLNNKDLSKISKILEDTFELPGDRASLELIIMKVLPLQSVAPGVFLEAVFQAYKPHEPKADYQLRLQQGIWEELQTELVKIGYIVPVLINHGSSAAQPSQGLMALSLKDMMKAKRSKATAGGGLGGAADGTAQSTSGSSGPSFLPSWPVEGIDSSTVFKYLQHDGKLRGKTSDKQASVRGINQIPHLEIKAGDSDNTVLALFSNNERYRVLADEPEYISAMETKHYLLAPPDKDSGAKAKRLEISNEILNKPFIEATHILHEMIERYKSFYGLRPERRNIFNANRNRSPSEFTPPDMPPKAERFWAEIVAIDRDEQREVCAEAFKIANKVVYKDDILREMTTSLAKLNAAMERIEKEIAWYTPKRLGELAKQQQDEMGKLHEKVRDMKILLKEAEAKQNETNQQSQDHPEDPIKEIIYPSFDQNPAERPEWQNYQIEYDVEESGQKSLIVLSKQLAVRTTEQRKGSNVELTFEECNVIATVQPLTSVILGQRPRDIKKTDTVVWLGFYLAAIEDAREEGYSRVVGYFKVVSQMSGEATSRNAIRLEDLSDQLCQLI
ncbi:hypothetical protein EG329_001889 [Mollisiaceae sp. DMI_Dod_QoI]|nr:hypothetical protein EG329_001889 [Helotiales sp. DMI_Dod_QoI]